MKKLFSLFLGLSCFANVSLAAEPLRSPYQIIDQAKDASWRKLDLENTLVLQLQSGRVVIELNKLFAPNHVANTKKLVRQGFYKNKNFYRVIDGFVAEGGDVSRVAAVGKAQRYVKSERFVAKEQAKSLADGFVLVDNKDGYADQSGYHAGFPVGRNQYGEHWIVHCPGVVAMGRDNSVDSGGTDFYVVIGHAQRYLDRNVTAFGRVVQGLEHVQSLTRRTPVEGQDNSQYNLIVSASIASDLPLNEQPKIQSLRTNSADFKEIIKSRRNRPEQWFVERPAYVDVCAVPVPTRELL